MTEKGPPVFLNYDQAALGLREQSKRMSDRSIR
jgi:hypothetical protein